MKRYSIALMCVLAAACAVSAWAQTDSTSMGPTLTTTGKVLSWSPSSLVLQSDSDPRMTLAIDSMTTKPATDLKVGDRVTVDYHALANGTFHAAKIAPAASAMAEQPLTPPTSYPAPAPSATAMNDDVDDTDNDQYARTLPQTASPEALVGLIGLLALGGAVGLRAARRS